MYVLAKSAWSFAMVLIPALIAMPVAADPMKVADAALPQWTTKTAYQPQTSNIAPSTSRPTPLTPGASGELLLGATPDDGDAVGAAELAAYLSRALGRQVTFARANNWLTYSKDMTGGRYDLVLDSAHLTGWRAERLQHAPLVRAADAAVFVLAVHANDTDTRDLAGLRGRTLCAQAEPNLGTLAVMAQFNNPARQPHIVSTADADESYRGLASGKCAGAILPARVAAAHKEVGAVLYRTRSFPGIALSAGPRINAMLQTKIVAALTSADGARATERLRQSLGISAWVPARSDDYAGLGLLLKDSLYYR